LSHFKRHIALVGGRTMILLPLLLFLSSQLMMMYTMENSALYRNPEGDFSIGDFKRDPFRYLWAENITSPMVEGQFDCTFLCVAEAKCYSFNMAAYPDSKGLYLCELLATDKYRETKNFHANATFHHYSPWVRDKCIYFPLSLVRLKRFTLMLPSIITAHGYDFCIRPTIRLLSYQYRSWKVVSWLTFSLFNMFSRHVKVILARTVLTVSLNMSWIPIAVTVSWDSVEQTVNMEV